jgi:hypothetical protein
MQRVGASWPVAGYSGRGVRADGGLRLLQYQSAEHLPSRRRAGEALQVRYEKDYKKYRAHGRNRTTDLS